jgi:hypothetical protein
MLAQVGGFVETLCLGFLVFSGSRGYPLRGNIGLMTTTSDVGDNYQ